MKLWNFPMLRNLVQFKKKNFDVLNDHYKYFSSHMCFVIRLCYDLLDLAILFNR